jgi:exodeoxyribonuclease V beta subunit
MTATTHPTFDLLAPLPVGRLAIEASAGTGKTYALAALATRFVAEADVGIGELLIVTFTRAATTELRARVRTRLAEAAAHLARPDPPSIGDDPVLRHLAATDRELRRVRLEQAVTDFDAATISTIHGFAAQVLATIGAAGGADPDLALVDDGLDLAREVCADVLATASVEGHDDLPKLGALTSDVLTVLGSPDLLVQPEAHQMGASDADLLRARLVQRAVRSVDAHRRRHGSRGFTDVLTDLRDALRRPDTAAAAIAALRARYRVALIDEFQDTDPVQWAIFSTLFTDPPGSPGDPPSLVLVGDPKQAIYAFRGANVHTYVDAVTSPGGSIRSLATNHRSDGAAVRAVDALLDGLSFGSEEIAFAEVAATPEHEHRRLTDRAGQPLPALSIRLAVGDDLRRNKNLTVKQPDGDQAVWSDLVAQVRHLLDHAHLPPTVAPSSVLVERPDPGENTDGESGRVGPRVQPSDIAVLVRSFKEAGDVQQHLVEQGVPAVLARGGSVLESDAAEQWRWLLDAVARPSDPTRARTFALSWFVGHDAGWVATCTDEDLAQLQDRLRTWGEALSSGGVTVLLRRVWSESGVTARVLARPDGDRAVTDLEHLAELVRTQVPGGRASVAALLALLDTEPEADPDLELEGNLASRRVESEAEAVQILTVWVAKGLEFPITCCPTLWKPPRNDAVIYQDTDLDARAFDLAGGHHWPTEPEARLRGDAARAETSGEDLRLLYVALTRARHQTLLWWVPGWEADTGGLARVLFGRTDDGRLGHPVTAGPTPTPADPAAAIARIAALVEPGVIAVGTHGRVPAPAHRWSATAPMAPDTALGLSTLDRTLDRTRHRWSFTAISARADHDHLDRQTSGTDALGPDEPPGGADEALPASGDEADLDAPMPLPAVDGPTLPALAELIEASGQGVLFAAGTAPHEPPPGLVTSPLASLPASAEVGTLVHEILEQVCFDGPDLRARLRQELGRQLSWRRLDLTPVGPTGRTEPASAEQGRSLLADGLAAALETSLGAMFDHRPLSSFSAPDRLVELGFELRLGEGGRTATDRDIGRLLLDHLPDHDPFRPWAEQVAAGAFAVDLAGHLNGSIDLILRVVAPDRPPRFAVLDYKTNRLHDRGVAPEPHHYQQPSMAAAMAHHHYPLQALLYAVALHRYLRWRQPGYEPATHLAGATYLFVRGMAGPTTPVTDGQPDGVSAWPLPSEAVAALSDLLHGRQP